MIAASNLKPQSLSGLLCNSDALPSTFSPSLAPGLHKPPILSKTKPCGKARAAGSSFIPELSQFRGLKVYFGVYSHLSATSSGVSNPSLAHMRLPLGLTSVKHRHASSSAFPSPYSTRALTTPVSRTQAVHSRAVAGPGGMPWVRTDDRGTHRRPPA